MKYFKNDNNQVFAFDDNCDEKYINKNLVKISETEAIELTKPVLSDDEIIANNESKQQQLLNEANEKIVILQRALKYNCATEDEKSLLEQLELFTIAVARVNVSDVDAVFPEMP